MRDGDVIILRGEDVLELLTGREAEVLEAVGSAYVAHQRGFSSLPHSTFLRFPDDERNRIIALPAYVGDGGAAAGIKWIASFPGNLEKGLDRASAVIILNSMETGRPTAILEGSVISAKRTAAAAALAAKHLHAGQDASHAGLIGCGLINFEVVRFLRAVFPVLSKLTVADLSAERAAHFKTRCEAAFANLEVEVARDAEAALAAAPLVSLATTAIKPHLSDISACAPGSTILHVSLRDFSPEVILAADNVVDDVDHVCRAQTSVHLAEQQTGNREFIRCTLADVLTGEAAPRRDATGVTVFSPFGLGVLD
ncbi:MAG TPA: 2,3-diaminopropionate biosynthesis protein SbnB, partial [Pyrinomonadaceae bacterium]|nr:2,3-diaminopropionate biosynthesis protein SbnB [Pyrinomonadaceae bacterium]